MTVQEIKEKTLIQSVVKMLMSGKVQTQNDIVQIARVIMTDLEIGFKEALLFFQKCQEIQDELIEYNLSENGFAK